MFTPEQKLERQKAYREAWLANHPGYYKKGGKGYSSITRPITCECGQATTADHLRQHQRSWKHKRLMEAMEAKTVEPECSRCNP